MMDTGDMQGLSSGISIENGGKRREQQGVRIEPGFFIPVDQKKKNRKNHGKNDIRRRKPLIKGQKDGNHQSSRGPDQENGLKKIRKLCDLDQNSGRQKKNRKDDSQFIHGHALRIARENGRFHGEYEAVIEKKAEDQHKNPAGRNQDQREKDRFYGIFLHTIPPLAVVPYYHSAHYGVCFHYIAVGAGKKPAADITHTENNVIII